MGDLERRRTRGRERRRTRMALPKVVPIKPLDNKLPLSGVLSEEGLEAVLSRRPYLQKLSRKKLGGDAEAHLIAFACSETPEGCTRWSLRLLADRMVELGYVESISHEAVRRVLKKTS